MFGVIVNMEPIAVLRPRKGAHDKNRLRTTVLCGLNISFLIKSTSGHDLARLLTTCLICMKCSLVGGGDDNVKSSSRKSLTECVNTSILL